VAGRIASGAARARWAAVSAGAWCAVDMRAEKEGALLLMRPAEAA